MGNRVRQVAAGASVAVVALWIGATPASAQDGQIGMGQTGPGISLWRGEQACPAGLRVGRVLIKPKPNAEDLIIVGDTGFASVGYLHGYPNGQNPKMAPFCYSVMIPHGTGRILPRQWISGAREARIPEGGNTDARVMLTLEGRIAGTAWSGGASGNFLAQCTSFILRKTVMPVTVTSACGGSGQDIGGLLAQRADAQRRLAGWVTLYASVKDAREKTEYSCDLTAIETTIKEQLSFGVVDWIDAHVDFAKKGTLLEDAPVGLEQLITLVKGRRDVMERGVAHLECRGQYLKVMGNIVAQAEQHYAAIRQNEVQLKAAIGPAWRVGASINAYNRSLGKLR